MAVAAGVDWIVVEGGSCQGDWGGGGDMEAGRKGGFDGSVSHYRDDKIGWWLVMELRGSRLKKLQVVK